MAGLLLDLPSLVWFLEFSLGYCGYLDSFVLFEVGCIMIKIIINLYDGKGMCIEMYEYHGRLLDCHD